MTQDSAYYQRRAREELERAETSTLESAAIAHRDLAHRYLEKAGLLSLVRDTDTTVLSRSGHSSRLSER